MLFTIGCLMPSSSSCYSERSAKLLKGFSSTHTLLAYRRCKMYRHSQAGSIACMQDINLFRVGDGDDFVDGKRAGTRRGRGRPGGKLHTGRDGSWQPETGPGQNAEGRMYGRGGQIGGRPPPINRGCVQEWQQTAWQPIQVPIVYPQLNAAPLHALPGITLQPIPMQATAYATAAVPMQPAPAFRPGGSPGWGTDWQSPPNAQQQWQQRGPPPTRGFAPAPLPPQGRGFQARGGPSPGRARGREQHPGTHGTSHQLGNGQASQQKTAAAAFRVKLEKQNGSSAKNAKRMRKALEQLEQQEAAPKKARAYSAAEVSEGIKWQEDRRRNFPTETNLERKAEEAKRRAERGEVDVEQQDKRKALRTVLQLQRKLGLSKAAGTDCMVLEAGASGFRGRGRGGRVFQGGRGRGRHRHSIEYHTPPVPSATPAENSPGLGIDQNLARGGPDTPRQSPRETTATTEQVDGVLMDPLGLGGYDSCDEAGQVLPDPAQKSSATAILAQPKDADKLEVPSREPTADTSAPARTASATKDTTALGVEGGGLHAEHRKERRRKQRGKSPLGRQTYRQNPQMPPPRPSLLQRLLAKEIRQERSLLLQSFRFMVNNNFLQDVGIKALTFTRENEAPQDAQAGLRSVLKRSVSGSLSSGESSEAEESE